MMLKTTSRPLDPKAVVGTPAERTAYFDNVEIRVRPTIRRLVSQVVREYKPIGVKPMNKSERTAVSLSAIGVDATTIGRLLDMEPPRVALLVTQNQAFYNDVLAAAAEHRRELVADLLDLTLLKMLIRLSIEKNSMDLRSLSAALKDVKGLQAMYQAEKPRQPAAPPTPVITTTATAQSTPAPSFEIPTDRPPNAAELKALCRDALMQNEVKK